MRFVERYQFGLEPGEVWVRASNIQEIPRYWHGTRELKVTKVGEKTLADVVFAFGGKGKEEIVVDQDARKVTIDFLEGPFRGKQTISVNDNVLAAEWDVTFNGAYKLLGPMNASHFRSGTRNALKRLCSASP